MMNKLFTLLLAAGCFTVSAQVPDYVPNEGLVGWYAFDGDATNAVSFDGGGEVFAVGFGEDRFGNAGGALAIINSESSVSLDLEAFVEGNAPRTIAYWLKRADNANEDEPFTGVIYNAQGCMRKSFACGANIYTKGVSVDFSCGAVTFEHASTHEECGWNHVVVVVPSMEDPKIGNVLVYENGELLNLLEGTAISEDFETIHGEYRIGGSFFEDWGDNLFDLADQECGAPMIDDLAFYQRDLSSDEVLELYLLGPPVFGCTDVSACNFNASANVDDGSCLDCDLFSNRCLDGTIWSEELQGCVVANPSDTDFDTCVGMTDLLNLLSLFGTCAEPEVTEWTCGDPLEYQGYDYETVHIGEQCWFAENLRSENYKNGDSIPAQLSEEEWGQTSEGATAIFGEGDSYVNGAGADEEMNLTIHGRLYNGFAVQDSRGLCPLGWSVSTAQDWADLRSHLEDGGLDSLGVELRTAPTWNSSGAMVGRDSQGMSWKGSGNRMSNGHFNSMTIYGEFRLRDCTCWAETGYGAVDFWVEPSDPKNGASVRCIKD